MIRKMQRGEAEWKMFSHTSGQKQEARLAIVRSENSKKNPPRREAKVGIPDRGVLFGGLLPSLEAPNKRDNAYAKQHQGSGLRHG